MANNDTVAHAWAHQTGRDRDGNSMHYVDSTIFSYGTPLARLVQDRDGRNVVLMVERGRWSSSTAKHLFHIAEAITHLPVFTVENVTGKDHRKLFAEMVKRAAEFEADADTRKLGSGIRGQLLAKAAEAIRQANDYAKRFRLRVKPATLGTAAETLARAERAAARAKVKAEARREEEQAERRAAWQDGHPLGDHYHGTLNGCAVLRVRGDTLETSLGASVPLAHAVKAFGFVKLVRERGEPWARNGRTVRVGHFQVDRIEARGDIVAGCHKIAWSEVERIATQLGVIDAPASDEAAEPRAA